MKLTPKYQHWYTAHWLSSWHLLPRSKTRAGTCRTIASRRRLATICYALHQMEHLLQEVHFVIHTDHENYMRAYFHGIRQDIPLEDEFSFYIVHMKGEKTMLVMPCRVCVQTSSMTTPSRNVWRTCCLLDRQPLESHGRSRYFLRGTRRTEASGRATVRSDGRCRYVLHNCRCNHEVDHNGVECTIIKLRKMQHAFPRMRKHSWERMLGKACVRFL
jgi:hypothetical protein